MNRQQSLKNIALYTRLLASLQVWKDFLNFKRPDIKLMEAYISPRALPDLLTEGLGPVTVRHFLSLDCEFTLKEMLEEMESDLVPVCDFFRDDQLCEAYERLSNLQQLIEDLHEEEVG